MDEVSAARGGLVGGDGRPEEGTSGIPLRPCVTWVSQVNKQNTEHRLCHCVLMIDDFFGCLLTCGLRSAVVDALQVGGRVGDIAGGKDGDTVDSVLAMITTTITDGIHCRRHCCLDSRMLALILVVVGW